VTDSIPVDSLEAVPSELREVLAARGFTALTPVQSAVLSAETAERDLRIQSKTGSGKTVAFGFMIHEQLAGAPRSTERGTPAAVVLAPTRELAMQVQRELDWLLSAVGLRVAVVIGGTSVGLEAKQLARGVDVLVATPGRLVDHLERGSVCLDQARTVVLDEADQMLDLGFREALETIVGKLPNERRTLLVSATFGPKVAQLARQYQRDALELCSEPAGQAHSDIRHVVHLVAPGEQEAALVNLLLLAPDESSILFVRTREGAAELATRLQQLGFAASELTGELSQRERTQTLESFRSGQLKQLIATDVAARGLDVPEVTRVIQVGPPETAESYTHRSGRTGRAGRKGTSILLVPARARVYTQRLLAEARVRPHFEPLPTPEDVERADDLRRLEAWRAECEQPAIAERARRLAAQLLADGAEPLEVVARLAAQTLAARPAQAQPVTQVASEERRPKKSFPLAQESRPSPFVRRERPTLEHREPRSQAAFVEPRRTFERPALRQGPARPEPFRIDAQAPRTWDAPHRGAPQTRGGYHRFGVTWGARHGADPRRLLALCCRRGDIAGADIGTIDIGPFNSVIEVRSELAAHFARSSSRPDPRDPKVHIKPLQPVSRPS